MLCLTVDLDASPPVDLPLTHFMWDDCIAAFQVKYALLIHMWQMCAFPERRVTAVGVRWFVFGSTGVLYTLCSCRMSYTTARAALIMFSRSSVGGAAVPSSKSLNVLTLPRLQMQECRQYVKFDLYISWLVSSASINYLTKIISWWCIFKGQLTIKVYY